MGNSYERQFYIFKGMDGVSGNPSGFLKIEVNGDNAKLQLSLNNLADKKGFEYKLYGIRKDANELHYTDICSIPLSNGRADVKMNSHVEQIGSNGLQLKDINVYAVITRYPDRAADQIVCPLVSYTKQELDWRYQFEKLLEDALISQSDETPKTADYSGTTTDDRENAFNGITLERSNETAPVNRTPINIASIDKVSHDEAFAGTVSRNEVLTFATSNDEAETGTTKAAITGQEMETSFEDAGTEASDTHAALNNNSPVIGMKDEDAQHAEEDKSDADIELQQPWTILDERESDIFEEVEEPDSLVKETEQTDELIRNREMLEKLSEPEKNAFELSSKFQGGLNSIYKNSDHEVQENNVAESGGGQESSTVDVWQKIQDDFNDISSINISEASEEPRNGLSIPDLQEELDKSFEVYNPFKNRSRNFKWWKINSPGFLNNILFRNNIKTYLLFNPKVMLAHYKYRYIILGIRGNRLAGRERLVCGVPGIYSIDDNPFGSMGSWVQMEGYRPKYGAFGYWVVMIDPRTGKLIKIK